MYVLGLSGLIGFEMFSGKSKILMPGVAQLGHVATLTAMYLLIEFLGPLSRSESFQCVGRLNGGCLKRTPWWLSNGYVASPGSVMASAKW